MTATAAEVSRNTRYQDELTLAHSPRLFAARPVSLDSDDWVLRVGQRAHRVFSRRQPKTTARILARTTSRFFPVGFCIFGLQGFIMLVRARSKNTIPKLDIEIKNVEVFFGAGKIIFVVSRSAAAVLLVLVFKTATGLQQSEYRSNSTINYRWHHARPSLQL